MWDTELCADRVSHGVDKTDHGIGESHAGHCGGDLHLSSCDEVVPLPHGLGEVCHDKTDRMQGQSIGKRLPLEGVNRLHGMG